MKYKHVKNINDLKEYMCQITYGWVDKNGQSHIDDDTFCNSYILQSPTQILKSNIGVCWDQVELERSFFENNHLPYETYFIVNYDNDKCPTHTFLIYQENNKYYWFENSFEKYRGIHEYESKESLLQDVKDKFIKSFDNDILNVYMYLYEKPLYGLDVESFCAHCENGVSIKI